MRCLFVAFLVIISPVCAQTVTLKLWREGVPEPVGFKHEPESEARNDKGIKLVYHVSDPEITLYPAPKPTGAAVLVCPGGGYNLLASEHEGTQVCEWFNSVGITAVLLKYRVPRRSPDEPSKYPLQDAQRAMGLIHHHAKEWGIRTDQIGALGFSAGGHLVTMLALHPNERTYAQDATLDVEDVSLRFVIPVYPAYLVNKADTFSLKPEIVVTSKAPPIFLVHANNDRGETSASGSALLYLEYKKLGLPAELHIYNAGGHGFGVAKRDLPSDEWLVRAGEWMRTQGWITQSQLPAVH